MNPLYERPKCEHNTCAITGASAFFCGIKDAVIVVNGSGFCFRKMLNVLEHSFRKSFKEQVFCAELNENSIIYGNEKALVQVLKEVKAKYKPSVLFIQNNCAGSLIGDDVCGIARAMDFSCPIIALDTGGIKGTFNDGYVLAAKAFFREMGLEKAEPEPNKVNIIGVTRAYYNFSEDCKELEKLLRMAGIQINSFVAEEMSVDEARLLGRAALNIVIHSELGAELADYLEEKYHIPCIKLGPPYGLKGSKAWLEAICSRLPQQDLLLANLEKAFKPYIQEEKYNLNYFRKHYGDIWIEEVDLVGPNSVVKSLAQALRKEYINYGTMNLFCYKPVKESEHEKFYNYHSSFAPELVHTETSCFLFGSYYEQLALKRTNKNQNFGYACIATPNHNYINLSPLMGVGGAKKLLELLWQYYLDYSIQEYGKNIADGEIQP